MYSISFPNLGVNLDFINKNVVEFGRVRITWFGLIMGVAIILGCMLTFAIAKKREKKPDEYLDLAVVAIVSGIIGGHIYSMLLDISARWRTLVPDMLEMDGNIELGFYGSLITGALGLIIASLVMKRNPLRTLDCFAPGLLVGSAVGRITDFVLRRNFGSYDEGLFAMRIATADIDNINALSETMLDAAVVGEYRGFVQVAPLFLFEIAVCLLVAIFLLLIMPRVKHDGVIFSLYLVLYCGSKIFIDADVAGTVPIIGWASMNEVVSIGLTAVGTVMFILCCVNKGNGRFGSRGEKDKRSKPRMKKEISV